MTTAEGKPPDATQGLRDLVTNLKIESAQLAKSKTPVGQAGGTWLSRVARELEALLPALDAAIREGQPPSPRSRAMAKCEVNGWDERDYELWSKIQSLPSYGLVAGRADNPMISRKEAVRLLEQAAEKRFFDEHAVPNVRQ